MRVHLFNLFNLLFILLGSGAVMLAGSIPFGFSWLAAFHLRKGRLLILGFPWISLDFLGFSRPNLDLSMGYTAQTAQKFFAALVAFEARNGSPRKRPSESARLFMGRV